MTSQTGEQTITIRILPNMSSSKERQTGNEIWSGIEYNKRNGFF